MICTILTFPPTCTQPHRAAPAAAASRGILHAVGAAGDGRLRARQPGRPACGEQAGLVLGGHECLQVASCHLPLTVHMANLPTASPSCFAFHLQEMEARFAAIEKRCGAGGAHCLPRQATRSALAPADQLSSPPTTPAACSSSCTRWAPRVSRALFTLQVWVLVSLAVLGEGSYGHSSTGFKVHASKK